jgi:hypothetical protein
MPDPFDEDWASQGDPADLAGQPTLPAFITMPDGSRKVLMACTADELRAEAASREMQGRKLLDEAKWLSRSADVMEGHPPQWDDE